MKHYQRARLGNKISCTLRTLDRFCNNRCTRVSDSKMVKNKFSALKYFQEDRNVSVEFLQTAQFCIVPLRVLCVVVESVSERNLKNFAPSLSESFGEGKYNIGYLIFTAITMYIQISCREGRNYYLNHSRQGGSFCDKKYSSGWNTNHAQACLSTAIRGDPCFQTNIAFDEYWISSPARKWCRRVVKNLPGFKYTFSDTKICSLY